MVIRTIGHGTRPLEELIGLLVAHGIGQLADVRTIPRSRRNPQYNRETLPGALAAADIAYAHLSPLGGLRQPRADSSNLGWRNASFRGYADHMQTPAFAQGLAVLLGLAAQRPTAIMCAEAVPWRCHRALIADALTAAGVAVEHILTGDRAEPHALTAFARVEGATVTYPRGTLL